MSLNKNLLEGFVKYYMTVSRLGYVDIKHVNKLVIASWINDVLNGKYGFLVSDDQYTMLSQLYMCVEGDCLVPYGNYCHEFSINVLPNLTSDTSVKITETSDVRVLKDNNIRNF